MKRLISLLALIALTFTLTAQSSAALRAADVAYQKGEYREAAERYERIVNDAEKSRKRPSFNVGEIYKRLGESFLHLKEYWNAEVYFTKAYDNSVRGADFLINYGDALLANDKAERALTIYRQVLETEPQNARALGGVSKAEFNMRSKNDPRGRQNPVTPERRLNTDNNNQYALAWLKNSLVFSSDRTALKEKGTKPGPMRFYAAERFQSDWGSLRKLKPLKPAGDDLSMAFDNHTQTCYVGRCITIGKNRNCNIFASQLDEKDRLGRPVPQSFHHNHDNIGQPTLSSDGKVMFFTITRNGKSDIYMAKKMGNHIWTTPQNLGSVINTNGDECYPQLYRDSILFFASNGHQGMGGLDIFFTKIGIEGVVHAVSGDSDLSQLEFSIPINLEAPINSGADDFALLMNPNGRGGFLISNRLSQGRNRSDIYNFSQPPHMLNEPVVFPVRQNLIASTTTQTSTEKPAVGSENNQAVSRETQERDEQLAKLQRELEAAHAQLANNQTTQPAQSTLPVVSAFDPGIRYRVQLMATSAPIANHWEVFGELLDAIPNLKIEVLRNVDVRFPNYYHYVTSASVTRAEAVAMRDRIRKFARERANDERVKELGIENSFIATFQGGRRVNIQMQ
ncbi:MAG: hypothetical protein LBH22_06975 [Bacteroidales bacterium]|jgi:tetratricopeptide (TPR) repeat protein|nr:hypothetical protein [Bacteroidales bacterium]